MALEAVAEPPGGLSCGTGQAMAVSLAELKRTPLYSEELGIALQRRSDQECFKWFLASLLFGGRISETIARNTYRAFERHKLLTPRKIRKAGWSYLVYPIMWEGGYVRYDGRKSSQVLRDCETLLQDYGGSLEALHAASQSPEDLEDRLLAFFGIGPVTVNIFLRELRPYWRHADPAPLPRIVALAEQLGVDLARFNRKTVTFTRIEAGLIRRRRSRGQSSARPHSA